MGKKLLTNKLALQIFSLLGGVKATPIPLGWYNKNLQVISPTPMKDQLTADQMPKRIRKLPLTWKEDFFMEILEEPETGRTINSDDCKCNMNQDQAEKFLTPKYSKKVWLFFTKTSEVLAIINLTNYIYIFIYNFSAHHMYDGTPPKRK